MTELTNLLAAAGKGDAAAANAAFTMLYDELRRLARAKLRAHQTFTLLDTTALVHESYLRLSHAGQVGVADRAHFFAYAARVMRSVIVDFARARLAERRGGGQSPLTLDTHIAESIGGNDADVVRIHDALEDLGQVNPRLVQVVEMRYFAGLTERQIAESLGISERTVKRDWEKARVLMLAALG